MDNLNRLKAVLADAGQTNKWLAEQLGKDPVTVSIWCTNTVQPDLLTLSKIAELLNVDIRELLVGKKKSLLMLQANIEFASYLYLCTQMINNLFDVIYLMAVRNELYH